MTDSEPVPRGKGEKVPLLGELKVPEIVCLQSVGAKATACLLHNEPATYSMQPG
jgi:hypothetical protein